MCDVRDPTQTFSYIINHLKPHKTIIKFHKIIKVS